MDLLSPGDLSLQVSAPSTPAPSLDRSSLRPFGDAGKTRAAIYQQVHQAASSLPPLENTRYSLSLHDVDWADKPEFSLREQKAALLEGRTLQRRLRGSWRLTDRNTGKVVSEKRSTIAGVPYLTPRGTFILAGSDWSLGNQSRLVPGIYHRQRENGLLESHIATLPGKGVSHRLEMEPETGVFKLNIAQSSVPLFPVLRLLGAREQDLQAAWGNELYQINKLHDEPRVIDKLYQKLVRKPDHQATPENKYQAVRTAIESMQMDPVVNQVTLGHPYERLGLEPYLASTRKLLALNKGETEPDDRDHLAFQNVLGPEDLFAERFHKAKSLLYPLLWKATNKGSLEFMPSGVLTRHLHGAITDSGLGQVLEGVNSIELLDLMHKITRLGTGGISSTTAVPQESRAVQPSHLGYVDSLKTPESTAGGIDLRMARSALKGPNNQVYSPFMDVRTGREVLLTPRDLLGKVMAFPGELESGKPLVMALSGGKFVNIPREKVDYALPHMENGFTPASNLVPLKSTVKGQRVSMGSRFLSQAMPLTEPEAPLVQGLLPGTNRSFEEEHGKDLGAVFARDVGGRVERVSPDGITVRYDDGHVQEHELYNWMPSNRKTAVHNTPLVQPGERLLPNQLLARSNQTDEKGVMALGKNLRVAYLSEGNSYEDAFVLSRSAASKLESQHVYQHELERTPQQKTSLKEYVSIFPGKYDRRTLQNLDEYGVIKPGTQVQQGDPLILAAEKREGDYKRMHSAHKGSYNDASITWDHHAPGVVTDAVRTDKGTVVVVRANNKTQEGDKISGKMGDKGVVLIKPDDEMPHDAQGRPFDVLVNPLSLVSRVNVGQIYEALLGKVAQLRGEPYKIEDFDFRKPDMQAYVAEELRKHGVSSRETVTDPLTGQQIPNVLTGVRYYLKLHHVSEHKGSGRGLGSYTAEGLPARGGEEGAKKQALGDVGAMLSSGALEVIKDGRLIRGAQNPEYWATFMSGNKPATPPIPFVYEKFLNQLRGAGVNIVRKGKTQQLMALTDHDIDQLAGDRELQNAETVDWRSNLKPIRGGLFDDTLFGGHAGNRWGRITLAEPMLNPLFEEPTRRVLGLTQQGLLDVLAGKKELQGMRGPQALQAALESINIPQAIRKARADIASGKKGARDEAVRRLGYLLASEKTGVHPRDWVLNKMPVLPPLFRPVSLMQGGGTLVADSNQLYKELFDANQVLGQLRDQVSDLSSVRSNVYQAMKAVTGLGDPVGVKSREKGLKGLLKEVFGSSPKYSTVQQKLLGTTVNLVGRGVIAPDPDLTMDEVGIPEEQAWSIYSPFVMRRLRRRGVSGTDALRHLDERSDTARKALLAELDERPVILTRAPVLHRYGNLALFPRLVRGTTVRVNPFITKGLNADFDGDTCNFHAVSTDEAREEAVNKMLPSRNLLAANRFDRPAFMAQQEYIGGMSVLANRENKDKEPRVFATRKDALRALSKGEIDFADPVTIIHP